MRVAVVEKTLCRPDKCNLECVRFCPINRGGAKCVWIDEETKKARISEELCVGCGICVKKCPFHAISIVNLPEKLKRDLVHRYGPNAFELFRLPIPKEGKVLGIIGGNGIGKSTSLKLLSGKIKPNLGRYDNPPDWDEIIRFFRGSELQPYFEKLSKEKLRVFLKPQTVDMLPKIIKGEVGQILSKVDETGKLDEVKAMLSLENIWERNIANLSGGELQKVAIAAVMLRDADVYLFDEPASYLDIKERLRVAKAIRSLASPGKYVVVVEHDLAVLDYTSDLITILYGEPGVYGISSFPRGVRTGINAYIEGYLREENVRIRDYRIEFYARPPPIEWRPESVMIRWGNLRKKLDGFELNVEGGEIHRGEVIGILGPNGIGKTTFVKMLAGILEPDEGWIEGMETVKLSYKPQFLGDISFQGTVRELFSSVGVDLSSSFVQAELIRPLRVYPLLDRYIEELSGGELQRVLIVAALGRDADIYLLDEPMAYLDVEQRYAVARSIKRLTAERNVATFVVEHDIVAMDFLATTLMVFNGEPGIRGNASSPLDMRKGMNIFLKELGVTFRRDPHTKRPRINKEGSWLDRYQKEVLKEYYYVILEDKKEE
ncbi:MAG: ribosome biogenesis/translation initiation ATPase RLI [Thermoprotei archaeon]|nr:MAG: ribosome biogenesis/translation initiation ATPase RLI [Thermoprotei archaeon]